MMRKKLTGLKLLTWALISPALAVAAPAAELKLIGAITPGACIPTHLTGSVIDYGIIPANTLNATEPTKLPVSTKLFQVVCEAPVKFGISVQDERSATTVSSIETVSGMGPTEKFGLGVTANGENIGAYSLVYVGYDADPIGATTGFISSADGGVTWANLPGLSGLKARGEMNALAESASVVAPGAFKRSLISYQVYTTIDKTENLSITDTIDIDGLATFEVKYL